MNYENLSYHDLYTMKKPIRWLNPSNVIKGPLPKVLVSILSRSK